MSALISRLLSYIVKRLSLSFAMVSAERMAVGSLCVGRILVGDGEGRARVEIGVVEAGHPLLVLRDEREQARFAAVVDATGPELGMTDAEGRTRIRVRALDGEDPNVALFDENGRLLWESGIAKLIGDFLEIHAAERAALEEDDETPPTWEM